MSVTLIIEVRQGESCSQFNKYFLNDEIPIGERKNMFSLIRMEMDFLRLHICLLAPLVEG